MSTATGGDATFALEARADREAWRRGEGDRCEPSLELSAAPDDQGSASLGPESAGDQERWLPDDHESSGAPENSLVRHVQRSVGQRLRSVLMFGSCLSPGTRRPDSIPDLFAVVDDLKGALQLLGASWIVRALSPGLPPVTLSLRDEDGTPLAKLNLVEPGMASAALLEPRDLYLAGRLGKYTKTLFARDADCRGEIDRLRSAARSVISRMALLGLRRRVPIESVLRRCVGISYEAEIRPERPGKVVALFDAFAGWYQRAYAPLIVDQARVLGIEVEQSALVDRRTDDVRAAEAGALSELLARSRWRAIARWPKAMLGFRGWLPYVVAKVRRARAG